jgi:hypothetical protein
MSQNLSTGLTICLIIAVAFLTGKMYSIESPAPAAAQIVQTPLYQGGPVVSAEVKLEILRLEERLRLLEIEKIKAYKASPYAPQRFPDDFGSHTIDKTQAAKLAELQAVMDALREKMLGHRTEPDAKSKDPYEDTEVLIPTSQPGTSPSIKIPSTAEELARMERRAKGSMDIIEPRVGKYLAQKNYAKAFFQIGNFPAKLLHTASGKELLDLKERLETEIGRDYKEQVDLSQDYVKKGQYSLAIDHLETLKPTFQCHAKISTLLGKEVNRLLAEYDDILKRPPPVVEIKDPKKEEPKTEALDFKKLIQQLSSDDYVVFKKAKETLQSAGSDSLPDLIAGTESENANIRRFCITLLSQMDINDNEKMEQAYISALRDEEPQVCFAALSALGKIISYKAVSDIIDLVNRKNSGNRIAKKAVATFNTILDFKVPGSSFLSEDNVDAIQRSMRKYWEKNKASKLSKP